MQAPAVAVDSMRGSGTWQRRVCLHRISQEAAIVDVGVWVATLQWHMHRTGQPARGRVHPTTKPQPSAHLCRSW